MATDVTIGGSGELFADEDKQLVLEVLDSAGVPVNIAGWTIILDVRLKDNSPGAALLSKTAAVSGTYDAVRVTNTQRATVTLTDDETHQFVGSNLPTGAKTYRHSWKRTDSGAETVLCRGDWAPEKATAP